MIVAGFGLRGAATEASLREALDATGAAHVDALATPADKSRMPVFRSFAAKLDLPVVTVQAEALQMQETDTQSDTSLARRGTGSVAEACALAAAWAKSGTLTHDPAHLV